MSGTLTLRNEWEPRVLSIVRIVGGLIFMEHGLAELFGFPSSAMRPGMFELYWFAGIIELVGGALVTVGLPHPDRRLHPVRRDRHRLFHSHFHAASFP